MDGAVREVLYFLDKPQKPPMVKVTLPENPIEFHIEDSVYFFSNCAISSACFPVRYVMSGHLLLVQYSVE